MSDPIPTPAAAEPEKGDRLARRLREELGAARRKVREYREEMEAAGLTSKRAPDDPGGTA